MVDRAGREKLIGDEAVLAVEIEDVESLDRAADGQRAVVQKRLPAADDRVLAEVAAEDVTGLEDDGFFLGSHGDLAELRASRPPATSGQVHSGACRKGKWGRPPRRGAAGGGRGRPPPPGGGPGAPPPPR